MDEYMKKYTKDIEEILNNGDLNEKAYEGIRVDFVEHIRFFQHERLIHLLVTILFSFLVMFGVVGILVYSNWMTILFTVLVLIPEVFYILHYYRLENGVQKMYRVYDRFFNVRK